MGGLLTVVDRVEQERVGARASSAAIGWVIGPPARATRRSAGKTRDAAGATLQGIRPWGCQTGGEEEAGVGNESFVIVVVLAEARR